MLLKISFDELIKVGVKETHTSIIIIK